MNIKLSTVVQGNYKEVMNRFDRDLFEALAPKGVGFEIVEFTGSKKGDRVHLRFTSPVRAEWVSDIVADEINAQEAYFVDKGIQLPFPLKYWEHKHVVRKKTENTCIIIDDMTFRGPNFLISLLLYPAIFIGFYPRKKIYKKYFGAA
ncbi:MAG: cyclase [Saprospiraceae bacterium]|nr:cyclase [Saprospiraceae bacterium]